MEALLAILTWIMCGALAWYIFCTVMYIKNLKKSINCHLDSIALLDSLPDDIEWDRWTHIKEIIVAHDRIADMHKANANRWEQRGDLLRLVRRNK